MNRSLIAYATKMGMSEKSAEIIAEILQEKYQQQVTVIDLDKSKINEKQLQEYNNIIIGSGIRKGKWYKRPLKLLKSNFKDQKIFIYICSMGATAARKEKKLELFESKQNEYLEKIIEKEMKNKPISVAIFGGKKKDKGKEKRENWKKEEVEKWADKIGKEL